MRIIIHKAGFLVEVVGSPTAQVQNGSLDNHLSGKKKEKKKSHIIDL